MSDFKKIISKENGEVMLSARKVAKRLSCAPDYVGKLCREGKLEGDRVDNAWFVKESSIATFEKYRAESRAVRSQALALKRQKEQAQYRNKKNNNLSSPISLPVEILPSSQSHVEEIKLPAASPFVQNQFLKQGALLALGGVFLFTSLVFAGAIATPIKSPVASFGTDAQSAAALASVQSPFFSNPPVAPNITNASQGNFFSSVFAFLFGNHSQKIAEQTAPAPAAQGGSSALGGVSLLSAGPTPEPVKIAEQTAPAKPVEPAPSTEYGIGVPAEQVLPTPAPLADLSAYVTQDALATQLQELSNSLRQVIYANVNSAPGPVYSSGGLTNNIALSQKIDTLSGVAINGGTITGAAISGGSISGLSGIDLASGCFSVAGVCLTSGGNAAGSTGAIQFNTGGAFDATSTQFVWDIANNRLGIGTSSPSQALSLGAGGIISITSNDGSSNGCFAEIGGQLQYSNDCSTFQSFTAAAAGGWTDTGSVVHLTTGSEAVGIGTSTPYAKLTLWGTDTSATTNAFEIANSASTTLLSVNDAGQTTLINLLATGSTTLQNVTAENATLANATTTALYTPMLGVGVGNYFTSLLGTGLTNNAGVLTVATTSLGLLGSSSLSASAPLAYNASTGGFSISQSGLASNGYLSSADFAAFNNKISSSSLSGSGVISYNSSTGVIGLGGVVGISNGGTGTSTAPTYGQLLVGNISGGYDLLATSSLGISGLSANDFSLFNNKISSTSLSATYPLQYNSSSGIFSLGFGTTTANTFSQLQTFSAGILTNASSTLGNVTALNATTTNLVVTGGASSTSFTVSSLGGSGTSCVQADASGKLSSTGAACGSGSGAVNSVANSDGTLSISPTTGAVVASLNTAHANSWSALQQFAAGASTTLLSANSAYFGGMATSSFSNAGVLTLAGGYNGPLQAINGVVSATTSVGVLYGGTGSTTLGGILTGNGAGALTSASIAAPLSFAGNTLGINQANALQSGYLSNTDFATFNNKISSTSLSSANNLITYNAATGVFTASTSPTFTSATTTNLVVTGGASSTSFTVSSLGGSGTSCVQADASGKLSSTGAACGSGSGAVNSVANSDGTLSISPTTGAVVASLNTAHANSWSALQTFSNILLTGSTTLRNVTALNATTTNATTTSFAITSLTSTLLKTNANGSVVPAVAGVDYAAAGGGGGSGSAFGQSWEITDGYLAPTSTLGFIVAASSTVVGNFTVSGTADANNLTAQSAQVQSLTLSGVTGSVQCLHVSSSGVVSGTGSDCGAGGGGSSTFLGLTDVPASYTPNAVFYTNPAGTAVTNASNFTFDGTTLSTPSLFTNSLAVSGSTILGTIVGGTWQGTPITDAYISDALTINGGTINNSAIGKTGASTAVFTFSTSTVLAVYKNASFGGTATSSFNSAGALTLASALTVANGGTGSTTLGGILTGNGAGALTSASIAAPLSFAGNTLSIAQSGTSTDGYLSSADFNTFTDKISSTSLSATGPLEYSPSTGVFTIAQSNLTTDGYLSSADFNTFNNKISSTSLSSASGLLAYDAATGIFTASTSPSYGFVNATDTNATSSFAGGFTAANNFFNVLANGLVGIGTANPGEALQVNGRASADSFSIGQTVGQYVNNAPWYGIGYSNATIPGAGAPNSTTQLAGYYGLDFVTAAGDMVFNQQGQLGIGTTSPSAQLGVAGGIYADGNITTGGTIIANGNADISGTGFFNAASTSNLTISLLPGALLATNAAGAVQASAVSAPLSFAGNTLAISRANALQNGYLSNADFVTFQNKISSTSLSATYPLQYNSSSGIFSLGFGTTTANTFSQLQTFGNITAINATTSQATTTSFAILSIASSLLKTLANGSVVPAVSGVDYAPGGYTAYGKPWEIVDGYLAPTTTLGIIVVASSTIGDGTQAGGLTINGGATTTGSLTVGSLNGPLQANNGALSATTSIGVMYGGTGSTTLGGILTGNGTGVVKSLVVGSGLIFDGTTLATNGSGINAIGPAGQTQSGGTQTFATSTTGTDFTITASANTQTFNLPFASLTSNGKLSSTDFATFNNKINFSSLSSANGLLAYNAGTGVFTASTSPTFANATSTSLYTGTLNLGSALAVNSGGTGAASFGQGWLFSNGGTGALAASTSPTVNYLFATSTTATSTFNGGFSAAGSLYVLQNGNVGIGNSAPGKTFDVTGTGRFSSTLTLSAAGTVSCSGTQALQTDAQGNVACGTVSIGVLSTAGGWTDNNAGTVALTNSADSVGIGATSTPYAKLSIVSGSAASTTLALLPASGQTANIIDIYNTSGAVASVFTAAGNLGLGSTSPSAMLTVNGNGYFASNLTASTLTATGTLAVNGTTLVTTLGGNVGIGTSTPSSRLAIVGGDITHNAAGNPSIATTVPEVGGAHAEDTYVSGNYAYVADYQGGLKILDISNPANPTTVGQNSTYVGSPLARAVVVAGKYAYVADQNAGLVVFDVSKTSAPSWVSTYPLSGGAYALALSGQYIYITDFNNHATRIIDISNPVVPVLAGSIANSTVLPYYYPIGLAVSGKYLYIADFSPAVYAVDISNPASPTVVGAYTGASASSPTALYASGKYVYVADQDTGLYTLDVSNPTNPVRVGIYPPGGAGDYMGVQVAGNNIYVADHSGKTLVLDISTSTTPSFVGSIASAGLPNNVFVAGKYAYLADNDKGLDVVDINGLSTPAASIGSLAAGTANVSDDLNVGGNGYFGGGIDAGISGIYSRGSLAVLGSTTLGASLTVNGTSTLIGLTTLINGLLTNASSTLGNFTAFNATTTNATTTSIFASVASSTNLFATLASFGTLTVTGQATLGSLTGFILGNNGKTYAAASSSLDLPTSALASSNISQFTNDSGYLTPTWSTSVNASNQNLSNVGTLGFYGNATKLQNITDTYNNQGLAIIDGVNSNTKASLFPQYRSDGTQVQPGDVLVASSTYNGAYTFYYAAATSTLGFQPAGNYLTAYDAFAHPAYGGSATSSLLTLTGGLLINNASSTIVGNLNLVGNATTTLNAYFGGKVGIQNQSPSYALDVSGFINTDQYSGFKQAGNTVLYASSTMHDLFLGQASGNVSDTGGYNTGVGLDTVFSNTTGQYNIGIGPFAVLYNKIGNDNIGIGYQALEGPSSNPTGSENIGIGTGALAQYTTGYNNIALGTDALQTNTTGFQNVAVGYQASQYNTIGADNFALGNHALFKNTTGNYNVGLGVGALVNNDSATSSIAIGFQAAAGPGLYNNQGGTAVGYQSGYNFATGSDYNTLLGYQSGYNITTGANNILIGANPTSANANLTTGSNNIGIGYNTQFTSPTNNNQLNIQNILFGTNNAGTAGTYSTGQFGIGSSTPWARLSVQANNGDTNTTLFAIASSTQSATTTLFSVDNVGNTTAAGQFIASLGTVTNPSFSFAGKTNYGLWLSGSTLVFGVNGGSVININSTGIGANAGNSFFLKTSSGVSVTIPNMIPDSADSTTGFAAGIQGNLNAIVGGNEITRWTSTGFGIGTTSPFAKLSLAGSAGGTSNLFALSTSTAGFATTTALTIDQNGNLSLLNGSSLTLSSLATPAGSFLAVNTSGQVISTTTSQFLTSLAGAASSTLLGDTNTWSGTDIFNNLLTLNGGANVNANSSAGYQIGGNTVLYASTTNYALAVGASSAAAWMSASSTAWYDVAIGSGALSVTPTSGTAQYNIAVGLNVLGSNTTGNHNSAVGANALQANITGNNNVVNGYDSLYNNLTGSNNIAMGVTSLFNATSSSGNTAIGYNAGNYISGATGAVGSYNTLLGNDSGFGITTGGRNVFLGQSTIAASYNQVTTGSNNISIGNDVAVPSQTASNQLDIGNLIYGTSLDGTGSTLSTGLIGIGTTSPFAKLSLAGTNGGTSPLFAISTSTSGFSTSTALTIDQNGNLSLLNGSTLAVTGSSTISGAFNSTFANSLASTTLYGNTLLTNATSSSIYTSTLGLGSGNYFTSLLGTGLTNVAGVLTVNGGQAFSTTSQNYYNSQFRDWNIVNGYLTPTSTVQSIGVFGSSTIGNGTQTGGLTISGGATTTGNAYFGGKVGIGTMSPVGSLGVVTPSNNSIQSLISAQNPSSGSSAETQILVFNDQGNTPGANGLGMFLTSSGYVAPYTSAGGLFNYQNGPLVFGTNSNIRMYLSAGGNLGIGATAPDTLLTIGTPINSSTNVPGLDVGAAASRYISVGQDGTHMLSSGWHYNATAGNAYGDIATYGYNNPLEIDGSTVVLQSQSGGSVGIGTTTPWAQFAIHAVNGATNTTLFAIASSTQSATTTLFSVSNTGNVGIGSTTPSSVLSMTTNNTSKIFEIDATNVGAGSYPILVNADNNTGMKYCRGLGAVLPGCANFTVLSYGALAINSDNNITLAPGNSAALTAITNSNIIGIGYTTDQGGGQKLQVNSGAYFNGNVGIGTTNPGSKLEVQGLASAQYFNATSSTNYSTFTGGFLSLASSTIGNGTQTGGLTISGGATTTGQAYFAGNVGIGTVSPQTALEVDGADAVNLFRVAVASNPSNAYLGFTSQGITLNRPTGSNAIFNISTANQTSWGAGATAGAIQLSPNGSTAMTLLTNGNVGIGTTSPFAQLSVATPFGATGATQTLFAIASSTGGTATTTLFKVSNTGTVNITTQNCNGASSALATDANGNIYCEAGVSDQRLKTNITPLATTSSSQSASTSLDLINALNPVSFNWKDPSLPNTGGSTGTQYGLIAQQVQQVLPNLVGSTTPTYLTPGGTMTVNYTGLVPVLVSAVQEQQWEIASTASATVSISNAVTQITSGDMRFTGAATTTIVGGANAWTIATSSTSTPIVSISTGSATTSASVSVNGTLYVNGQDVGAAIASSSATTTPAALTSGPFASASDALKSAISSALGALQNIAQGGVRNLGAAVYASAGTFNSLFAQTIVVDDLTAQTVTAEQKLCVGSTCVTETQLQQLLNGSGSTSGSGGEGSSSGSTSTTTATSTTATVPPTISINGDNPATINVGDTYSDLGAQITGPTADLNLGVNASVDGGATTTPDQIHIDTSTAGMHTIIYSATPSNSSGQADPGNTGYATRTVDVVAASSTPAN